MPTTLFNWFRKWLSSDQSSEPENTPKAPIHSVNDLILTADPTQLDFNLHPKKSTTNKKTTLAKQKELSLETDSDIYHKLKSSQQKKQSELMFDKNK